MEILPYNDGAISRTPDGGAAGDIAFVHLLVFATLPMVHITPPRWIYFCLLLTGISGECASHFQQHLQKYPPQVSSRNAAAGWGCFIHNEVNAMLDKPLFDCNNIGDFYDCGCAEDDEQGAGATAGTGTGTKAKTEKHSEAGGENQEDAGKQSGHHEDSGSPPVQISKEE